MNWQNAVVRIEQGGRLSQIDQELSGQQFFEEPEKKCSANPSISLKGYLKYEAVGRPGLPAIGPASPPHAPAASATVERDAPADPPCRRSEIAVASGGPAINLRARPNVSGPSARCRRSPPLRTIPLRMRTSSTRRSGSFLDGGVYHSKGPRRSMSSAGCATRLSQTERRPN